MSNSKAQKRKIQIILELPISVKKIIQKEIEGNKFDYKWTSIINQIVYLWLNEQDKEFPDKPRFFMKDPPTNIFPDITHSVSLQQKIREYRKKGCIEIRPRIPIKFMEYLKEICDPEDELKSNSKIIMRIVYKWLDSKGYLPDIEDNE